MKTIYEEIPEPFKTKLWYLMNDTEVCVEMYELIKEEQLKLLDNQIELAEKNITTETPDVLGGYYKMIGYNRALEDQITSLKEQKKLIEN